MRQDAFIVIPQKIQIDCRLSSKFILKLISCFYLIGKMQKWLNIDLMNAERHP